MVRNFKELTITSVDDAAHRFIGYPVHARYCLLRNDSDVNISIGTTEAAEFRTLSPTDEYEFSPGDGDFFDLGRFYYKAQAAGKILRVLYK